MSESEDPRTKFFAAAMEILAADGYSGLKLAPLCSQLSLTTGAFYHSFASWQVFTSQLLQHWHDEETTRLISMVRAQSDPKQQIEELLQVSTALPHRSEAAIRVWAGLEPRVRQMQESVDRERLTMVRDAFTQLVGAEDADLFAKSGMYLLIGYEQSDVARDPVALEWCLRMLQQAGAARA